MALDPVKAKEKERAAQAPDPAQSAAFVAEIGQLVRRGRAKRGLTRRQLAQDSGISERYLAQIESGQGNPSVIVMKAIADVFEVPVFELLPHATPNNIAMAGIIDRLSRVPQAELPPIAAMIEQRVRHDGALDRARRIALVGLRGAGKSTLGKRLAERLNVPFVELNRVVEQDYGASVSTLIEMSGVATFRRYERACLEKVIEENDAVVIATAGGIVASAETYALLLRRTHTIWLRAAPQDHMSRVIEQGDFRPMAQNREAMSDLVAILEARRADYAQAEAELETSGDSVEESTRKLEKLVKEWMK
ncbi:MAG: helix-turn-helix transcriptional regulator [Pseudorhodoplanes sp.]|nr:helix-turn-helix transcriptional regulator [Pseudorhodoplanes sp.]